MLWPLSRTPDTSGRRTSTVPIITEVALTNSEPDEIPDCETVQGLDKSADAIAAAVDQTAKVAKPRGRRKADVPDGWAIYADCVDRCVESGEGCRVNRHSLLTGVYRLGEFALSNELDFRLYWRKQQKRKLPDDLSNPYLPVMKKVAPEIGRRTRSANATVLLGARECGVSPDNLATWLAEKGGIERKIAEYRSRHRTAAAKVTASTSRLVILDVPNALTGLVTVTLEISNGRGRFIRQTRAEMVAEAHASPVIAPGGEDADRSSIEIADGLDAGTPPSVGHQAHETRCGGDDAAGESPDGAGVPAAA
jgi:hypothetical protein